MPWRLRESQQVSGTAKTPVDTLAALVLCRSSIPPTACVRRSATEPVDPSTLETQLPDTAMGSDDYDGCEDLPDVDMWLSCNTNMVIVCMQVLPEPPDLKVDSV